MSSGSTSTQLSATSRPVAGRLSFYRRLSITGAQVWRLPPQSLPRSRRIHSRCLFPQGYQSAASFSPIMYAAWIGRAEGPSSSAPCRPRLSLRLSPVLVPFSRRQAQIQPTANPSYLDSFSSLGAAVCTHGRRVFVPYPAVTPRQRSQDGPSHGFTPSFSNRFPGGLTMNNIIEVVSFALAQLLFL